MTQICLISTSNVRPIIGSEKDELRSPRIELTPCDLQLLQADHIQKGLLFHKATKLFSHHQTTHLIQHLKHTLSRALAIFYPLAGRLGATENIRDETTTFFVDCNGEGAQFVHAVAAGGVTAADVLNPDVPDDVVYSFFALNKVPNSRGLSRPLLAVQVTELADSFFIACTANHCVVDGSSFWHFFNTWAEISRAGRSEPNGVVLKSPPPFIGRKFLDDIRVHLPIRLPFSLDRVFSDAAGDSFAPPPLKQRVFHFSKETIELLKVKANSDMGADHNNVKISSLQALMAHLWVSITRNRRLKPDDEVTYGVLVGLWRRLDPPLPEHYFGNAVLIGMVKSTAGELLSRGPSWAALEINKTIARQTADEVRKFLEKWAESADMKTPGGLPGNFLITGSSPRFDVYGGNDFGWGRPLAVRSGPGNKSDGKLTVFPGAEEGSVDFEACLSPETLAAMANDEEFTATLSGGIK